MTYLDANATEPLHHAARAAVLDALGRVGNPSSIHAAGRAARRLLEGAREDIAVRYGAEPAQVVFTSGGTEASALAIAGLGRDRRRILGATEHDAVRAACGADASTIPVDRDGVIDLAALAESLRGPPALVCLMLANNETGTLQPIAEAAALCHRAGALLHVDAVQAAGRMRVDLGELGADGIAISGHKMGGPPGAGALLLAPGHALAPLIAGGGQERGRRGGTPALPAIAGLAAAARETPRDLATLRDRMERAAIAAGAVALATGAARLGNTASLALPGIRADRQVIALDLAGIAVSAGAACSSGKVGPSHVLAAMGLGSLASQTIRVSLPWNTTEADIDAFAAAYAAMAARLARRAA